MSGFVPLALYLVALAIRLTAASQIPFPTTEPSAYYLGVAHNLLAGEGLVSDGVWSFATPPLMVPKPAFELWLPMSSFISAAAMAVLGSTFWAAQVGGALVGAAVAPLAWALGRDAASVHGLDGRRGRAVALASGLLAATLSPLVLGSIVPDSYTPFTVLVLAGALLIPRVIGARDGHEHDRAAQVLPGLGLGLAMGLAYLARQEVVWLGATVLLMLAWALRTRPAGGRLREAISRLWPVVAGGLVVVVPWLLRNWLVFGSPLPGQAAENMFLLQNEDIFAFVDRPDAATYLGQGLATVLWNPLRAAWDGLLNVIVLPAFPVGIAGLVALVAMRRSPALRRPTALVAVLGTSMLTFVTTVVLFPVATLWGTFMHSSGPLLVALGALAALGGDALLARVSSLRRWERPNVILAPVALIAVTALLSGFTVLIFAEQSRSAEARYGALAKELLAVADSEGRARPPTLISDHPIWLAEATSGYVVALPDEDLVSLASLAQAFDAPWVVVVDERGRYPDALLTDAARACLDADPARLDDGAQGTWLFKLAAACSRG